MFEDPSDPDQDVVDLLAQAGPPPEKEVMELLFRPRPDAILHRLTEWIEHWRAHIDNRYYFRPDIADEIFEFDGVKCSIV